jgi:hypothetical protein
VILRLAAAPKLAATVLYPGTEEWTPLDISQNGPETRITVPLQRNCAIVRLTR